jgi:hypothetical protein
MVHFSDKEGTPYTVDQPLQFLSQRAINRRLSQGIPVDETDFPVNPHYIQGIKDLGIELYFTSRWLNAALIQTDAGNIPAVEALNFVDSVEFVAKGPLLTQGNENLDTSGGAPINGTNTNNRKTDLQNEMIGVDDMHEAGYKGEGMLIGVMDGGFSNINHSSFFEHLFINDQIAFTYDLVRNEKDVFAHSSHGTRVLSILAAQHEDSFTGIVPNADFALFATEHGPTEYRIEEYNLVMATEMADSLGADVINVSVGYNIFFDTLIMDYTYEQMDGQTTVASRGMEVAASRGMIVVTSAGNDGDGMEWIWIGTPADADGVLSVGGVNSLGQRVPFSSVGPTSDSRIKPDIMALGSLVVVCSDVSNITVSNGTSFSSPLVAGLTAGLWQANPDLTADEIKERLRNTASISTNPGNQYGYGIPDFNRANENTVVGIEEEMLRDLEVYPNPVKNDQLIIRSGKESLKGASIHLFTSNGQEIKKITSEAFENKVILTLDSFENGVYILKIRKKGIDRSFRIMKY